MTDEEEAAGIERAAVALCWHARPVVAGYDGGGRWHVLTPREWWEKQDELEQRLHISRARVAIAAWENTDAI
jgi:hypothetical protein